MTDQDNAEIAQLRDQVAAWVARAHEQRRAFGSVLIDVEDIHGRERAALSDIRDQNSVGWGMAYGAMDVAREILELLRDALRSTQAVTTGPTAAAPQPLELLRRLEWAGTLGDVPRCPTCRGFRTDVRATYGDIDNVGHTTDCELAAALKEQT